MKKTNQGNQAGKKTKKRNRKAEAKVKDESVIDDSDGLGEMRDSISEMETELAAMDNDIANAEALEDPEMREIAVSGMRELKRMTTDMIDSTRPMPALRPPRSHLPPRAPPALRDRRRHLRGIPLPHLRPPLVHLPSPRHIKKHAGIGSCKRFSFPSRLLDSGRARFNEPK